MISYSRRCYLSLISNNDPGRDWRSASCHVCWLDRSWYHLRLASIWSCIGSCPQLLVSSLGTFHLHLVGGGQIHWILFGPGLNCFQVWWCMSEDRYLLFWTGSSISRNIFTMHLFSPAVSFPVPAGPLRMDLPFFLADSILELSWVPELNSLSHYLTLISSYQLHFHSRLVYSDQARRLTPGG